MTVSLADLPKGHEFAETKIQLTWEWVSEYIAAVEDEAVGPPPASGSPPDIPPLAVAALSVRALLEQASLPDGAIHAAQELSFSLGGELSDVLVARARIASRGERQGWVLMGIDLTVDDGAGARVMSGRATITFPVTAGAAA